LYDISALSRNSIARTCTTCALSRNSILKQDISRRSLRGDARPCASEVHNNIINARSASILLAWRSLNFGETRSRVIKSPIFLLPFFGHIGDLDLCRTSDRQDCDTTDQTTATPDPVPRTAISQPYLQGYKVLRPHSLPRRSYYANTVLSYEFVYLASVN
jgi:hypothetical protein